ncbi:division/cell wall cluster transcriptional repressor MraZ [Desulfatibacillum aliphaticivorans]|uniref:division/cell wall cluster transcriptional repressor MraZ n=1 Tax=Desulfatibacillum aliphaticivorans TaxID=218208 RepID=UPI000405FBE3|nr:division/cell wall cluster transcriptional repressor MraZ [Desulfatibacillum aliphaticivorans]
MAAKSKNFRGTSYHSTDEKARITVPARFREVLRDGEVDGVMVSRMDGALVAYPFDEWQVIENRIMTKSKRNAKLRQFRRFFVGGAQECMCDKQGRILVPKDLRDYAGIGAKEEIALVGAVSHFEIWDKKKYDVAYEDFEEVLNSGELDDEIEDMGL